MKKNITDKNMEKVRDINRISAPGNIISSKERLKKTTMFHVFITDKTMVLGPLY